MFEYFPNDYFLSAGVNTAIALGGEMEEIAEASRRIVGVPHSELAAEWIKTWILVAERLERLARTDQESGRVRGAGRRLLRAIAYRLVADRAIPPSPEKLANFGTLKDGFHRAIQLTNPAVEFVQVPWNGHLLAAIFCPAKGVNGQAPGLILWPGGDVTKEWIYLMHGYDLAAYGVSALIVDRPGSGEARLNELKFHFDSETDAAACIDYLDSRPDVDPNRIGLCDQSLGGYFAPRAAAFEKRLKCVVAWGAVWDWHRVLSEGILSDQESAIHEGGYDPEEVVSALDWVLCWPMGVANLQDYMEKIKQFTLEGIADKITCPILILHGENDRSVPVWAARKTYDACINSPRRELKIFTSDEGGVEHCQIDNVTVATDYIHAWVTDVLRSPGS